MLLASLVCVLFILSTCTSQKAPEVSTPLGKVRGFYRTSYEGKQFAAFEGIPYAQPPIGNLRFKEPKPVEPWTDVWEAKQLHTCMHGNMFTGMSHRMVIGHEDCLYVNVYSPPNSTGNLDVVVHIHGGAFIMGQGHMAQPTFLVDRNYVVVTFNYRLGVLGFFCTMNAEDDVSCNNGMKDQTMALRWIRDNIKSFGGNPDSVTITGLSAGAASVHYHYLSPLSKGLFHRGYSMSGNALNPWAYKTDPSANSLKIAAYAGCSKSSDLVDCLRQRPATLLVGGMWDLYEFLFFPLATFGPSLEPTQEGAFLVESPYESLKNGRIHDVPWVQSAAVDEGMLLIYMSKLAMNLDKLDERWDDVIHYLIDTSQSVADEDRTNVAQKIRKEYLGTSSAANLGSISSMFSDRGFLDSYHKASKLQTKAGRSVYNMMIGHIAQNSLSSLFVGKEKLLKGASHGDDVQFLFGEGSSKLNEADQVVTNIYLDMLDSFVRTNVPKVNGVDWRPDDDSEELKYVYIKGPDDISVETAKDFGNGRFWDSLNLKEYGKSHVLKDEL